MDAIQPSWSVAGKVAFRFFVVYFILFVLPFPFSYIPGLDFLWGYYGSAWQVIVPWIGKHVLALSYEVVITPPGNGSGDTTFRFVQVFAIALISLVACFIWSILDWRRKNYDQASYWTMIGMRYYLGTWMMGYGFQKIFMLQFHLSDARLLQTYGDSSPMGLLWTFMGYSYSYNLFTGGGEVLGGLLLLFRKGVTAGSLLIIAIMSNVVVLNFAYHVPVKLFSMHLLAIAIVLASVDGRRLFDFLRNRPVESRREKLYLSEGWWGNARLAATFLFAAWMFFGRIAYGIQYEKEMSRSKPMLKGKYQVKEFYFNGSRDANPGDTIAWKSFRIDYAGFARAILLNDHAVDFTLDVDTARRTFQLRTPFDRYSLNYRQSDNGDLVLWGPRLERDSVHVTLERIDNRPKDFILTSHQFQWINEYPDNR
ncbi:MAG TPA: hypothetical protein VG737_08815 [Cyclobacteriaceae bacterium]|nr:hypothetical protein [Cyclobacteriaceae bacterium]